MSDNQGNAAATQPAKKPRSFTLKASDTDLFSITIANPEAVSLKGLRQQVGVFLKQEDQFLNQSGALVSDGDEAFPIEIYAREGDNIFFKRFVKPIAPAPARAAEPATYTVERSPSESRSQKMNPSAHVQELRKQLGDFMKTADYFMDLRGGQITVEDKYRVGEIADKDQKVQIGPKAGKPGTFTIPTTDLPGLPTMTWNLQSPGERPDLLTAATPTGSTAPTTLTAQEYYVTESVDKKKGLFKKLGLDRGFIVKADPADPIVQSPQSPVWYVPSDQGPAPSRPAEEDTHRFWAAATKVISEMRKRGIHQAALNGSYSDTTGVNGVQLKSSYTRDLEEYGKTTNTQIYVLEERAVRKVTLTLSNKDLRPSNRFKTDVGNVVNSSEPRIRQYERLHTEIFGKYGHFFPTEIVLGGKWVKEYSETSSDINEQSKLVQQIKTSGDAKATTEDGTFGLGLAYGNYSDAFTSLRVIQQVKTQTAAKTGGASAASIKTDEGPWVNSLAAMTGWAVIETNQMLPIISLLEGDDAADQLRMECISLINEFATNSISAAHTAVDMESYVAYLHAREAERLGLI